MQRLAEICIRRPVFAAMIVFALVVTGAEGEPGALVATFAKVAKRELHREKLVVHRAMNARPGALSTLQAGPIRTSTVSLALSRLSSAVSCRT